MVSKRTYIRQPTKSRPGFKPKAGKKFAGETRVDVSEDGIVRVYRGGAPVRAKVFYVGKEGGTRAVARVPGRIHERIMGNLVGSTSEGSIEIRGGEDVYVTGSPFRQPVRIRGRDLDVEKYGLPKQGVLERMIYGQLAVPEEEPAKGANRRFKKKAKAKTKNLAAPVESRYYPRAAEALSFSPGLQRVVESDLRLAEATSQLAERVSFTVATKTVSGVPIQSARGRLTVDNIKGYLPDEDAREKAIEELQKLGFQIARRGRFATTVVGPARLLGEVLGQPMMVMRQAKNLSVRSTHAFPTASTDTTPQELFLAPSSSLSLKPTRLSSEFDHFVFAPPAIHFASASDTPPRSKFHSIGSDKIRSLLNARSDSVAPLTGKGVKVGIVDTGFETSHPFYKKSGFDFTAHASPGGSAGDVDANGHGTAMASNVFALAPKSEVHGVKQENAPYTDAVEYAIDDLGVDIVSCSWGWDREQSFPVLEASLVSIIEEGKLVLFAAGNGHYAWPGSMPQVISVGGVFADKDGNLEASNYASGFMSSLYRNRQVPDCCGLCGQVPKAIYIPMPVPVGCEMDIEFGGVAYPDFDETGPADGWVFASGTSAATPQVAGALTLLLEATKAKGTVLTNAIAKDLLQRSCKPVSEGRNAMDFPATDAQPNGAVGYGLVNVEALFTLAKSRGLI